MDDLRMGCQDRGRGLGFWVCGFGEGSRRNGKGLGKAVASLWADMLQGLDLIRVGVSERVCLTRQRAGQRGLRVVWVREADLDTKTIKNQINVN